MDPLAGQGGNEAWGDFSKSFEQPLGDHDLDFRYTDPDHRLGTIRLRDRSGKPIPNQLSSHSVSFSWQGNKMTETNELRFQIDHELPDETQLFIYLATPDALLRTSFSLSGIPLP